MVVKGTIRLLIPKILRANGYFHKVIKLLKFKSAANTTELRSLDYALPLENKANIWTLKAL